MLALRTYEVLGCEGAARVDFRITPRGRPVVLEINTAPGMTEKKSCCRWRRRGPRLTTITSLPNGFLKFRTCACSPP